MMTTLIQDVRYGLRMLAKNPGFTAVAVLTLALGIGANTAVFTLIDALMLRSLPVDQPQQLYLLCEDPWEGTSSGDIPTGAVNEFSYHLYQRLRQRNSDVFDDLAAMASARAALRVSGLHSDDSAWRAEGCLVTGNFFRVLGVKAAVGRTLLPDDDREGDPRAVAVVSFHYWTESLGRNPNAVGQIVNIDGAPFAIVGVAPPKFFGFKLSTRPPDFYLPLGFQPQLTATPARFSHDDEYWLDVFGRLKPGLKARQTSARLTGQLQQVLTAQAGSSVSPKTKSRIQQAYIQLVPGAHGLSSLRERFSDRLRVLTLLAALVSIIACLNIANLLLARGEARQREIGVRLAVGAGRTRVIRQLLTESVVLAAMGGIAGLLLAAWATKLLANLVFGATATLPFSLTPDIRVLAFTLLASSLTGIAAGLAPALRCTAVDVNSSLQKSSGRLASGDGRPGQFKFGRMLVAGQVVVSLSLLVLAGLFVRSLKKLEAQDLGFKPDHVLACGLDLGAAGYTNAQLPTLYGRLLDRVRSLPGVQSAAMADASVLGGSTSISNISIEGYAPKLDEGMNCHRKNVTDDYFATDGMTLLAGRPIGREDTVNSSPVAVVDEAFVKRYFPKESPLRHHFEFGSPFKGPGLEVVGVVKDAKYESLSDQTPPMCFMSAVQSAGPNQPNAFADDLELRVAGDPGSYGDAVRRTLREIDRNIVVSSIHPLPELVASDTHDARLIAQLSSFFGVLALLLAGIGLYGVMAYNVLRRTNEIGIRMALGALSGHVLGMVLRESLLIVGLGVAAGIPVALGLARLVSNQLFDLSSSDPATLAGAVLVLVAVSALSGFVPARRASKVDPMVALRYE
jgi:predicted permease